MQDGISNRWKNKSDLNEKRKGAYEREKITKSRSTARKKYRSTIPGDYNEEKNIFD